MPRRRNISRIKRARSLVHPVSGPTCLIVSVHLSPEGHVLPASKATRTWVGRDTLQEMIEHEVEAINGVGMQARWTLGNGQFDYKAQKKREKQRKNRRLIITEPFFHRFIITRKADKDRKGGVENSRK